MKHSFPKLTLNWSGFFVFFVCFIAVFSDVEHLRAQSATTLVADLDNTLIEDAGGLLSNGSGNYFFSGRTGQATGGIRRGLVHFSFSSLPANAVVDSVSLILNMTMGSGTGSQTIDLHRVMASWGEGTSAAAGNEGAGAASTGGDATWIHRFYDTTQWVSAGGDFLANSSGSQDVPSTAGNNTWAGAGMVADVNYWLAHPDSNFGWILIGNESTASTSRRFGSHNNADEGQQPRLFVRYTVADASEDLINHIALEVFPNPAQERISLKWAGNLRGTAKISILDNQGREVWANTEPVMLQQGNIQLQIPQLSAGMYLLKFSSEEYNVFRKLMVR
ncbi:MAG: DNRLRE domain-containing protein [Bacteroidia bacterium]